MKPDTAQFELRKQFTFEAAHRLDRLPPDHPCSRLHGHRYRVTLLLRGPLDPVRGWIRDTAEIKSAFRPHLERLDHHFLNDIEGLEVSTCEKLSQWIYDRVRPQIPELVRVVVSETDTTEAAYPCAP